MKSQSFKFLCFLHSLVGIPFAALMLLLLNQGFLPGMSPFHDLSYFLRLLIRVIGFAVTVLNPISVYLSSLFDFGKEFGIPAVYYLVFILSVPLNSLVYAFVLSRFSIIRRVLEKRLQPS